MSAPGYLTDAELAPVNGVSLGGEARMARNAAARMNRAIAKLEAESGIRIVFSDWGLYRTAAIQIGIGGTSVANSAHTQGVGADIYNQRTYRNWNEPRFVQIMAEQGFIFDVDGEPWHVRGVNTAPAGGATSPFPDSTAQEGDMTTIQLFHQVFGNDQAYVASTPAVDLLISADWARAIAKGNKEDFDAIAEVNQNDWFAIASVNNASRAAMKSLTDEALDANQAELLAAIRSVQGGGSGGGTPDVTALAGAIVKLLPPGLTKADLSAALDGLPQAIRDEIIAPD